MTHACSVGVNPYNVEKWRERLRSKAVSFQQVLKEQIGFEPLVVYVDNAIDDNDLERISCNGLSTFDFIFRISFTIPTANLKTHERTLNLTYHSFANSEQLKNSLFKRVVPLWNALPEKLK